VNYEQINMGIVSEYDKKYTDFTNHIITV
jgi:hypothetical protein